MIRVFVVLAIALWSTPQQVAAHALAPSLLTFELGDGGRVTMRWRAPVQRPTGQSLAPEVPTGCKPLGEPVVEIDEDGRLFNTYFVAMPSRPVIHRHR